VVYSLDGLTALQHGQLFAVNSSTGDLYVRGPIDYEKSSVYHLTVVAADRGASTLDGATSQSSTAIVTVCNHFSRLIRRLIVWNFNLLKF